MTKGQTGFFFLLVLAASILAFPPSLALAQVNCAAGSAQVNNQPLKPNAPDPASIENPNINVRHIFCGEVVGGRSKGFHSMPNSHWPTNGVGGVATARFFGGAIRDSLAPGGPAGTNNVPAQMNKWPYRFSTRIEVWDLANAAWGQRKWSTFFPDACTMNQVVSSVRFAYTWFLTNNGNIPPNGAWSGPSGPDAFSPDYCYRADKKPLFIAGYFQQLGGDYLINSAFPL